MNRRREKSPGATPKFAEGDAKMLTVLNNVLDISDTKGPEGEECVQRFFPT